MIRLALVAGLAFAAASAAQAQCIVNPGAIGAPCVNGGTPPLTHDRQPVLQNIKPPPRATPAPSVKVSPPAQPAPRPPIVPLAPKR
ncbi:MULTISPECIES: hypothetical protein [Inquilinus]|uniref:Uncharacterized protein n=1 Tax=Inquilinus ginsengisoli TaxID=363840 RepID=A0ABU1JI82_9PROT|nr:hypothetical protein [Inquilinus ginsengisoli]MDR6288318.1 hypothetical protein [Inquilinus ginsengisoli]